MIVVAGSNHYFDYSSGYCTRFSLVSLFNIA